MSDEFKLQWSVSLAPVAQYAKGHMFNFRGNSVEELDALFDAVLASGTVQKALDVAALLTAAEVVVAGTAPAAPAAQTATVTQLPAQDLKTCAHGVREFKTGTNKNTGKAWAGWFCPEKVKANQCAVIWRD